MHYPFIFEEINIFLNISEFAVFVLHIKLCFISRKSNMLQNVASLKQKKRKMALVETLPKSSFSLSCFKFEPRLTETQYFFSVNGQAAIRRSSYISGQATRTVKPQ